MWVARASVLACVLGLVALSACSQAGPVRLADSAGAEPAPVCAADRYQVLVGQLAGEVDMESLPQPVEMLAFGATPGTPQRGRMLLQTGADGRISEVRCDAVS